MSTVDVEISIQRRGGPKPIPEPAAPRIPRITRLMALAIKFDAMIAQGEVRDYADLARLGYVTRARLTQIMNLLNLAPDIQLSLLQGSATLKFTERHVRRITLLVSWDEQRRLFCAMSSLRPLADLPREQRRGSAAARKEEIV